MAKVRARTAENTGSHWLRLWLPVAGYMALIFYLSSLPHPDEQLPKILFEKLGDKLLHIIEYAVLGFLFYRAFRRAAGSYAVEYAVVLAIAASSMYGATDEMHQAFVPFRTSTWSDWIADTAGAVIGVIGSRRVMERGVKGGIS
ncbi:MAG TPA: VanZ family protein [Nitrospira sp.]|nr:VanZ family protein [Nitrospira sp.]